jgi:hypothetical protein
MFFPAGKLQELPVSDHDHERLGGPVDVEDSRPRAPPPAPSRTIKVLVYSRTCPNDASTRHIYAAKSKAPLAGVVDPSGLIKGMSYIYIMKILFR